jgi:hypothetical protein
VLQELNGVVEGGGEVTAAKKSAKSHGGSGEARGRIRRLGEELAFQRLREDEGDDAENVGLAG